MAAALVTGCDEPSDYLRWSFLPNYVVVNTSACNLINFDNVYLLKELRNS